MAHRAYLRSAVCGGQWPQVRIAQLAQQETDDRCQLCHEAAGTLEHRRVCPAIVPDEGWPAPSPAVRAWLEQLEPGRRRTLQTRGLLTVSVVIAPSPAQGWFRWLVGLPDELPEGTTFYIDGSWIDGPSRVTGRAGYAIVVVAPDGKLLAYAYGVPPRWACSSAAAEAWALYMVLMVTPAPPCVITDCLGLLDTLERGREAATAASRLLARIWNLIFEALDGVVPEGFVHGRMRWMASHGTRATIGVATLSDGSPVTRGQWRANRLVDALARCAAEGVRVPAQARRLFKTAEQATRHEAAVLGLATHAANNHTISAVRPDGSYFWATRRDAYPPAYENASGRAGRRRARAAAGAGDDPERPQAAQLPPDAATTTEPDPEQLKAAHTPPERPDPGQAAAAATPPGAPGPDQPQAAGPPHPSPAEQARGRAERARRAREEQRDAAEARFLSSWLDGRARDGREGQPRQGLTAEERLAALRRRVAAKSAAP